MKLWLSLLMIFSSLSSWASDQDFSHQNTQAETLRSVKNADKIVKRYCVSEIEVYECRRLVLLKDENGKANRSSFYDNFVAQDRQVAGIGYYFANPDGTFAQAADTTFDGQTNVNEALETNQRLSVEFDDDGLPTIRDVRIGKLGAKAWVVADLIHKPTYARILGTLFEEKSDGSIEEKPFDKVYVIHGR